MKYPLIAFCDGDTFVFSNKDAAEIFIEPIDVENNEWIVFDATGKKLEVRVVTHRSRVPFLSKESAQIIESSSSISNDKDELKRLLIASIQALPSKDKSQYVFSGSYDSISAMPLEQLSMLAQNVFQKH